jgi:hypothetical protein
MLAEFIAANRADIIARCQEKADARLIAARSHVELDNCAPTFLDQLVAELERDTPMRNDAMIQSAVQHGHDLLAQGFTVSQVVHEYGDICQAVTEAALEANAQISTDDFRRLNRCLDDAIAGAVTEYGRARDATINRHADAEDQRLVALTTNLRSAIHIAKVALDVVKTGNVDAFGSPSSLLDTSLNSAHVLVGNLLHEFSAKHAAIEPLASSAPPP